AQMDVESLRICREKAEQIAPTITAFLQEEASRRTLAERLRNAEMLYQVASAGSADGDRVARLIEEAIEADAVTICTIGPSGAEQVAGSGANLGLVDALRFTEGGGVEGWIRAGCPEVTIYDARNDDRCDTNAALRRRVGSYCQIPLRRNGKLVGFL